MKKMKQRTEEELVEESGGRAVGSYRKSRERRRRK